jgi:hypothetical protein
MTWRGVRQSGADGASAFLGSARRAYHPSSMPSTKRWPQGDKRALHIRVRPLNNHLSYDAVSLGKNRMDKGGAVRREGSQAQLMELRKVVLDDDGDDVEDREPSFMAALCEGRDLSWCVQPNCRCHCRASAECLSPAPTPPPPRRLWPPSCTLAVCMWVDHAWAGVGVGGIGVGDGCGSCSRAWERCWAQCLRWPHQLFEPEHVP